jgi:hypothetical protein
MIGSIHAKDVVKKPEIIGTLDQRFIIIYDLNVADIGLAINLMAEQNWKVKQCWGTNARNCILLEKS